MLTLRIGEEQATAGTTRPARSIGTKLSKARIVTALRRAGRTRRLEETATRIQDALRRPQLRQPQLVEQAMSRQVLALLSTLNAECISAAEDWMAGRGIVTIRVAESLTQTERKILRSWFRYGEAVRFDPWDESRGLTNGRHRLWGTLPHFSGALVPVVSDALAWANPQDAGTLTDFASLYREDLDQLHTVRWFDAADPLNHRYSKAMKTAARGEFPAEA